MQLLKDGLDSLLGEWCSFQIEVERLAQQFPRLEHVLSETEIGSSAE